MALKRVGTLSAKTGEYIDDGNKKNRYVTVGALFKDEKDGRVVIKVDALPVNFDGWINAFPLREDNKDNDQQAPQPATTQPVGDADVEPIDLSDIPF